MADEASNEIQSIVNLAKARELMLVDADKFMPRGAKDQREKEIKTFDTLIANALLATTERLPERSETALDPVSKRAWDHVVKLQSLRQPAPEASSAYANLCRVFGQYSDLLQSVDILEWIEDTHVLPEVPHEVVDQARSAVNVFQYRILAQPSVRQWIEKVRAEPLGLGDIERRNFALMERLWTETVDMDERLVNDLSLAESASTRAWEVAKLQSDFASWLPHFEKVVNLTREQGKALSKTSGDSPYQSLLGCSKFNPDLRNETVNTIFGELRPKLRTLTQEVMAKQAGEEPPIPLPPVAVEDQVRVAHRLARALGLDEHHSRLDKSAHPFSLGRWDDVRITSRYREDDMMPALQGIIHEAGHAFYSANLPKEWKGQPIGEFQSMWIHETQSLFWEKQIAQSKEFMEFLSKLIKDELHVDGPAWSAENLYKLASHVEPSLIRVDADEVTYPAHVIMRHDLEQKLIDGTLAPKDVPQAWAKGMKEMLGIDVPDHARGCMQDVHWPSGLIGYFPAYTFGALGAAQLMEKLTQDMPDVKERIRSGDFAPIRNWLTERIHQHGSRYSGEELMEKATGKPLSAQAWLNHIQERYLGRVPEQGANWRAQASRDASAVNIR